MENTINSSEMSYMNDTFSELDRIDWRTPQKTKGGATAM